jgi:protein-disulfide isomerase
MSLFSRISPLFVLALLTAAGVSQDGGRALATATGLTFTSGDLSAETRKIYDQKDQLIAAHRKSTFDEWIFEQLIEMEAKARGTTAAKIEEEALAKIGPPADARIKAIYDGNRQTIGSRTLEEVRPNIIDYLKREDAGKQLAALLDSLKAKYKYSEIKDVGTALKAAEIAAQIGTRQITVGEFEIANRIALYNYRAGIYEGIKAELENAVYTKLLEVEAKKRNTDVSILIGAEITNKLKEYSDYERIYLEDMLQEKLFAQYVVKFNLPVLEPQVLSVSPDDDPFIGDANAKVTVVAFVDFQCSACAGFSPLLKKVVSEFGPNVRLAIRDYPLTSIHENSMQAARAGYAARQQSKFFEMADLMYRNQGALDGESLRSYAKQLGLDPVRFEADMQSPAAAAEITKDVADGASYGVSGTPTVFVDGVRLQRLSTGALRSSIRSALKQS